ncbi:MAG: response regulator [Steroidobacteraceae bacterium]
MGGASGGDDPEGSRLPWHRRVREGYREYVESLPLAGQFTASAVVTVVFAMLGVQVLLALWDSIGVRLENRADAARIAHDLVERIDDEGAARSLALLSHDRLVTAAIVRSAEGSIVGRYGGSGRTLPQGRNWPHPMLRFFGLERDYIEVPAYVAGVGPGTIGLEIDNLPPWKAILHRIVQLPFFLALGIAMAVYAANSLAAQVTEPLFQLAIRTRPRDAGGARRTASGRPDDYNELSEIAGNFEALSAKLGDAEREVTNVRAAMRREVIERTRELEERTRRAESVADSKDEFLANMSHEIRTPMNGVLGMAELLAGTDLDRRQRRYVDSMRTAAETMMQIINDILDDSKIEAGKMELVREPIDVRDFAEQVAEVFAGRAETKKLELICRVEPTVPAAVVGDALRLRQVLGNLVSNAVKYTQRGEIQIRIGLDALQGGQCRLHFSVSDTGPGIPEESQASVFDAFSQLGGAQRVGGTGLGLSIATRLVRLMGGEKIELWSQVGKGSSFSFVLPFEVRDAAPAPDAASDEFAGMRIMVVDDSPSSYMQIDEALSNWSAEVTVVTHGRMVRERLREAAGRERAFDAVLLDHSLPDVSTQELLKSIRLDPSIAGTWVVLLSAFDYDTGYEGTQTIEPDTCLAKPVRLKLLRAALRDARRPRAAVAADEARTTEAAGGPAVSLGLDVLVADDNEINREVAQAMLERSGCRVALAEDGLAAVEAVRARAYDVVLMDCQMPGMDGYAATGAVRRLEREKSRPASAIVALTANVLARDRTRCLEAGMNGFLPKPFTQEQLVAALKPVAESLGKLKFVETRPAPAPAPSFAPAPALTPPRPAAAVTPVAVADDEEEMLLSDTVVMGLLQAEPEGQGADSALPVLDPEQIAAIRGLGKPQVLERLCALLYQTAPGSIERLQGALESGDLEAVAAVAHSLKSPVSSLGGRRLADQLDRCESAARDRGDLSAARDAAYGLGRAYADLESALRAETSRATGS